MHITIHFFFFFFNDTATTEIYTLSLHDALPILSVRHLASAVWYLLRTTICQWFAEVATRSEEHTSESSHDQISYAVFCLKKKKTNITRVIISERRLLESIAMMMYALTRYRYPHH